MSYENKINSIPVPHLVVFDMINNIQLSGLRIFPIFIYSFNGSSSTIKGSHMNLLKQTIVIYYEFYSFTSFSSMAMMIGKEEIGR